MIISVKKHKNKLLVLTGFALLLVVGVFLFNKESVFGKQPGQPKNAQVFTLQTTRTFADFQAGRIVRGRKVMSLLEIPPGAELISANIIIREAFAPTGPGGDIQVSFTGSVLPGFGTCGSILAPESGIGANHQSSVPILIYGLVLCSLTDPMQLEAFSDTGIVDSLTQGIIDTTVSFVQH